MKNIFLVLIGWVLVPVVTVISAVLCMGLKVKDDKIIMAAFGLSLLIPIFLIVGGTWLAGKARGWPILVSILLGLIQLAAIGALALWWIGALAIMFSSYK